MIRKIDKNFFNKNVVLFNHFYIQYHKFKFNNPAFFVPFSKIIMIQPQYDSF